MEDSNSAAHVSILLKTGLIDFLRLKSLTSLSVVAKIFASLLSEKPSDLRSFRLSDIDASDLFLRLISESTSSLICNKNHLSIKHKLKTSSIDIPTLNA